MSLDTRLQAVFRDAFDNDNLVIDDNTSQSTLEGWDSFQHVKLLISVEDEFSVRLTITEAADMVSVGKLRALLLAKGVPA